MPLAIESISDVQTVFDAIIVVVQRFLVYLTAFTVLVGSYFEGSAVFKTSEPGNAPYLLGLGKFPYVLPLLILLITAKGIGDVTG